MEQSKYDLRIGLMASLFGPFEQLGKDSVRGAKLAVKEFGEKVGGRQVRLFVEATNAIPSSAVSAAGKLLEKDKADFVVGPLSGNEGLAIREFAKRMPDKVFINGVAGAQEMTLIDPAPNFFNFCTNGTQWMSGLAEYCFKDLGYKKIVMLGEDYSFPYAQVGGFMLEYCRLGGKVLDRYWVPLGTTDYREIIKKIPTDVDAIYVALGGTDARNFLGQYESTGQKKPIIAGSITLDQTVLHSMGDDAEPLLGVVSAGPVADDNPDPNWQAFVKSYNEAFDDGFTYPSLFAYGYYINMKAGLLAAHQLDGKLSNTNRFIDILSKLEFMGPCGLVTINHNRQAALDNFVSVLAKNDDGTIYKKLVKTAKNVSQTLGMPEDEYVKLGSFSRDNPPLC